MSSLRHSAVLALVFTWANPALAQERDPEVERLFAQGQAAQRRGELESARESYQAAWDRAQTPAIAGSLGLVYLKLANYADALEFLRFAHARASDPRIIRALEAAIDEAKHHVAVLIVRAPEGATVSLAKGALVRAPAAEPLFLNPGSYEVEVAKSGHESRHLSIELAAGEIRDIAVDLPPLPQYGPAVAALPEGDTSDRPRQAARGRNQVLVAGSALSAVSAGIGAAFGVASLRADSRADRLRTELTDEFGRPGSSCFGNPDPRCGELRELVDRSASWGKASAAAFVSAGVFAVSTGLTWALWPRREVSVALIPTSGGAQVSLLVGPGGAPE